jgi:hypothetical protein
MDLQNSSNPTKTTRYVHNGRFYKIYILKKQGEKRRYPIINQAFRDRNLLNPITNEQIPMCDPNGNHFDFKGAKTYWRPFMLSFLTDEDLKKPIPKDLTKEEKVEWEVMPDYMVNQVKPVLG